MCTVYNYEAYFVCAKMLTSVFSSIRLSINNKSIIILLVIIIYNLSKHMVSIQCM